MRKLLLPASMLSLSLLYTAPAEACTCVEIDENAPIQLSANDVVFEGTVLEIEDAGGARRLVTLAVERSFQGADHDTIQVQTGRDDASCGYTFKADGTYLVFASKGEQEIAPFVGACGRTSLIDAAGDTISALEAASLEAEEPAEDDVADPDFTESVESIADLKAAPGVAKPGKGKGKPKGCVVAPGEAAASSPYAIALALMGGAFVYRRKRRASEYGAASH